MKNIKDYLHLYLGCECEHDCWVDAEDDMPGETKGRRIGEIDALIIDDAEWFTPKPILRPLSDMTEAERRETGIYNTSRTPSLYPNQFKFLLSRGFDLFGLIEEKLALDKTKLKDRGL